MSSTIDKPEDGIIRDFIHEADASAAHDAAFVVEPDAGADFHVLGLLDLHFLEAREAAAVADGEFLQAALASLVADRAVERVIDEEELHHAVAAFLDEIAAGADAHVFGHRVCAGDDRSRHPADLLEAVVAEGGTLTRGVAGWHADLHEAHATISRRGELRVIAVVRHVLLGLATGLDHASAPGNLDPRAVNLHVHHALFGGEVLGEFVSGRACGVGHKSTFNEASRGVRGGL